MRLKLVVFMSIIVAVACNRDNPKHYVKEMVGTYNGTWKFVRNNGTTTEPGIVEVRQGSSKKTIYVGPEMAEFELNEGLQPIQIGNLRLSFPEGNTDVIRFERFWDSPYTDEFYGMKQND